MHDISNIAELIEAAWQDCPDDEERKRLGSEFYEDRAKGKSQTWIAFSAGQRADELPVDWNATRSNIAIFVSSEDEVVAVGDQWKNELYECQLAGIQKILASFPDDPQIHFYVRVHPNLIGVDNSQTRGLHKLKCSNLTIIPAESKVSTYALLRNARVCITFGSTVGVEAAYWGTPSILAGPAYYKSLGVSYNPENHVELIGLLKSDLKPGDFLQAIKYGYYWATFGEHFLHYKPTGIYSGLFKKRTLRASLMARLARSILKYSRLDQVLGNLEVRRAQRKLGLADNQNQH